METKNLIAVAAPEIRVADIKFNTDNIIATIDRACAKGVTLLVLPQKILTGCVLGDLFYLPDYKNAVTKNKARILDYAAKKDITVCLGGQLITGNKNALSGINLHSFNLPFVIGQKSLLENKLAKASLKSGKTEILCGASYGESTADGIYGGYKIIAANGQILVSETDFFGDNDFIIYDKSVQTSAIIKDDMSLQLDALSGGLARRMRVTGINKLVLGLSGGLDSTMALITCAHALERLKLSPTNLIAISMPCYGTTQNTKAHAKKLAELYGTQFNQIDITDEVNLHLKSIGHDFKPDTTFENTQARIRTAILFNMANYNRALCIGTGDLSESALGFCTYGGDHLSMYSVNCGLTKTHIRALVTFEAKTRGQQFKAVLSSVLNTPISPELMPLQNGEQTQKTEEIIGAYEVHDFYINNIFAERRSIKDTYEACLQRFGNKYTAEDLKKWLKILISKFFVNQFKRSCSPDGVSINKISFSPRTGFYMPSDSSGNVMLSLIDEL